VIKIPVEDVKRLGRSTQGVIVMRLRGDDETVSALAPVVESEETNGEAGETNGEAGETNGEAGETNGEDAAAEPPEPQPTAD
jgi:DNA gyrase/topoisomerase IV subunit A